MTVVKVGGSLFDHPSLGSGLRAYFASIRKSESVILVPGGGELAEAVRKWDTAHSLGDEIAHWIALEATDTSGSLLVALIQCEKTWHPSNVVRGFMVLEAFEYAMAFADPERLPHSWAITSDSFSARVAEIEKASRLVLLKSIDIPDGTPWSVAVANGWVDKYFPTIASRLSCPIEVVNFRRWLDENGNGK